MPQNTNKNDHLDLSDLSDDDYNDDQVEIDSVVPQSKNKALRKRKRSKAISDSDEDDVLIVRSSKSTKSNQNTKSNNTKSVRKSKRFKPNVVGSDENVSKSDSTEANNKNNMEDVDDEDYVDKNDDLIFDDEDEKLVNTDTSEKEHIEDDTTEKKKKKKGKSKSEQSSLKVNESIESIDDLNNSNNVLGNSSSDTASMVNEYFASGNNKFDFSSLDLKEDHSLRPCWVCPDRSIFLETFSPIYRQAYDFLVAISEPVSRPRFIHQYKLTEYSLYAAVSIGLEFVQIINILEKLSKVHLSKSVYNFIKRTTSNYGKVKLVVHRNSFYVESPFKEELEFLLKNQTISECRVFCSLKNAREDMKHIDSLNSRNDYENRLENELILMDDDNDSEEEEEDFDVYIEKDTGFVVRKLDITEIESFRFSGQQDKTEKKQKEDKSLEKIVDDDSDEGEDDSENRKGLIESIKDIAKLDRKQNYEEDEAIRNLKRIKRLKMYAFKVKADKIEEVKKKSIELDRPMLEEYDFRNDSKTGSLTIDLKSTTSIRSYQEKSLSKMFGNGRARSGIIVLPCGAGKTLVGITATCTVKKSTLILCINSVSCEQWKKQFLLWSNIDESKIVLFTSMNKDKLSGNDAHIIVTTYNMITYSQQRNTESKVIMDALANREWGLMVLDEVHVVPAQTFRRVIRVVKAHTKLGLTATLVREDEKIDDLHFLIGPKLYEANWLDLQNSGYLATVKCIEVWCPMTPEFYSEYLRDDTSSLKKRLLSVMNPNKIRACEYLIRYHEKRGDKIIVFSDNVYSLELYANRFGYPYIYGETSQRDRMHWLNKFQTSSSYNCIFVSKIGDTAIDLPEATVIIQVSSHYGSRRQEAQRLGRILRPKKSNGRSKLSTGGATNAYFYSLVSQDTIEMFYSSKRQQFLVDQGYSFMVMDNILEDIKKEIEINKDSSIPTNILIKTSKTITRKDELDLLRKVMTESDGKGQIENLHFSSTDIDPTVENKVTYKRKKKGLSEISSGVGNSLTYYEYENNSKGKKKSSSKTHPLLKELYRK